MTVRPAKFSDIFQLVGLMEEAHARSKYADRCKFVTDEAKQIFLSAIQRDNVKGPGGSCVFVSEAEGKIEGVIVGMTERVYHLGDKLSATDVFFYMAKDADGRGALRLFSAFEAWATENPKVIEIKLGIVDVIMDSTDRLAALYERRGYTKTGVIFERATG